MQRYFLITAHSTLPCPSRSSKAELLSSAEVLIGTKTIKHSCRESGGLPSPLATNYTVLNVPTISPASSLYTKTELISMFMISPDFPKDAKSIDNK